MLKEKLPARACIEADPVSHIIHVDGFGFWQPDEIDLMLDRLASLVAQDHQCQRRARVLVELGRAGAQMGNTVARIGQRSHAIYGPGDRLAIVLQSALLKMQISRVERAADYRIFTSPAEADAWLRSPAAS